METVVGPTLTAILRSWPSEPGLLLALLACGLIYTRGFLILRRRDPARWVTGRLLAYLSGLLALYLAFASPLEPFAFLLLQVHMAQHLVLMMLAPPLLWLGEPLLPLVEGLPRSTVRVWIAPLLVSRRLGRLCARLTHPVPALVLYSLATALWHSPRLYELALKSPTWHYLQHACFLCGGLLFWYPVVRPFPSRPSWSPWLLLPYLLVADVENTVLSGILTFSETVLYPHYLRVPRLGGLSALDDQSAAGVLMWVPGSLAFLLPLFLIGLQLMFGGTEKRPRQKPRPEAPARRGPIDLLKIPYLGAFLRWRHARLVLQLPLAVLAFMVVHDGLSGPQVTGLNLAGVLPWIHWRGLLVLSLLVAGNVFCLACPFQLPRMLGRRLWRAPFQWPRRLRSKWIAVALLCLFFWSYETFSLWDAPRATALLVLAYAIAALLTDGLFKEAVFCKYLCPIGQFNFVQSTVSAVQVKALQLDVCSTCTTRECIRGNEKTPGCELKLYLPRKVGNLDCTFCLDCVHSCPAGNVGILLGPPGAELAMDRQRSGLGRLSRRLDVAALMLVLVFGAFANAGGMVGPVLDFQLRLGGQTAYFALTLVVLPVVACLAAAALSRDAGEPLVREACAYVPGLVPVGAAMWLAHYCYHFLGSLTAIIPASMRYAADHFGVRAGHLVGTGCHPAPDWLLYVEILLLDLGLLLSLYTLFAIALRRRPTRAGRALLPWALLVGALFATGVWLVLQPMQMRGMS